MSDYKAFISDLLETDEELKKEVKLLELKYQIIDELIKFRKNNNLTQAEFADLINVKQQAISRFEKGEIDARISFISKVILGMKKKVVFSEMDFVKLDKPITISSKAQKKSTLSSMNKSSFKIYDLKTA